MRGPSKDDGTLAEAPLATLLADVHLRARTGTLQLVDPGGELGTLVFADGHLHKVQVTGSQVYLGGVLYELGAIDSDTLDATLRELSGGGVLHGRLLIERGAVGPFRLEEGLVEQMRRKVHALFSWSDACRWAFFEGADGLADYGGDDWPSIDVRPSVWRGVLANPPMTHVRKVLSAAGEDVFALPRKANVGRFAFDEDERASVECLRTRAMTVDAFAGLDMVKPEVARLLFYVLALFDDVAVRERAARAPVSGSMRPPSSSSPRVAVSSSRRPTPALRLSGAVRRPSSPQPTTDPADDLKRKLADATRLYRRGEIEQAEVVCRRAHQIDPNDPQVLALLAWLEALKPENQTPAEQRLRLEMLESAAELAPESASVLFYRGSMYKRFGNMTLAMRDFRRVLDLEHEHVDALREIRLHAIRQRRGG